MGYFVFCFVVEIAVITLGLLKVFALAFTWIGKWNSENKEVIEEKTKIPNSEENWHSDTA